VTKVDAGFEQFFHCDACHKRLLFIDALGIERLDLSLGREIELLAAGSDSGGWCE
jgi:hypothetical protein